MRSSPLISFCIATYKRPEFTKSIIKSIFEQKSDNFEIVIVEDNSDITSEEVIKSFKSKKIIFHKNETHLGQLKSYNKAVSLSKGVFIVLLADDDPPTPDMMEIFIDAYKKFPGKKAFWGGSYANITTDKIKSITRLNIGFNSLINENRKRGDIEILNPREFFKKFFNQEIFPHYQWTTAIIAKDVIDKIKGIPDYNSAHFIDYAYLLKIAENNDFVIINKEMGSFTLHEGSYGKRKDTLNEYKSGVIGFDRTVSGVVEKFGLRKDYEGFLTNYVTMFLINRLEHYRIHGYKINTKNLLGVYDKLCIKLNFLKNGRNELYLRLTYPFLYNFVGTFRNMYGKIKIKI